MSENLAQGATILQWLAVGIALGIVTTFYEGWRRGCRWPRWATTVSDVGLMLFYAAAVTGALLWTVWGALRLWAFLWMALGYLAWGKSGAPWTYRQVYWAFQLQRRGGRRLKRRFGVWWGRLPRFTLKGWWRRRPPPPPAAEG